MIHLQNLQNPYPDMLVQLHWEPLDGDRSRSIFVAQYQIDSREAADAFGDWMQDVLRRRECPEGWRPVVLTRDEPRFILAAETPKEGAIE
jgi:hypothetical protein